MITFTVAEIPRHMSMNTNSRPGSWCRSKDINPIAAVIVGMSLLLSEPIIARAQVSSVWAWEDNYEAVLIPAGLTNVAAIAASPNQSGALNHDGTVITWGDPLPGRGDLASITDAAAISLGWNHGLVLRSNGTAVAWGEGPYGENMVPPGLSNLIAVSAGGHYNLALKNDRTVVAWGQPGPWLDVPSDLSNVVAIAASSVYNDGQHNLALKNDGTVVAWGANIFGESNVPADLSGVKAVAAGYYHCLALKSNGTVIAWGNLVEGGEVPAGLSNVVAIAAGAWHNLALKSDGSVVSWKGNLDVGGAEHVPETLSNVTAIAAGAFHSLALSLNLSPYFRVHPQGQYVWESAEDGFRLYAEARGTPPLNYQWQKDGITLPGETNSALWVVPSLPTNGGSYRLVVSNPYGTATSDPAVITVRPFLGIFEHPAGRNAYTGENVEFSVHVKGTAPFHFQWRKDSNDIAGANSLILTLTNVQVSDAGAYDVIVTNITGSLTSHVAQLTIDTNVTPAITQQPVSLTVWPGARAGFRVLSTGAPVLHHQWRKNGDSIGGATGSIYLINSAQESDAGNYDVVITNVHGTITSSVVSLSVIPRIPPTLPPAGTVVNLTGALLPDGLTNIVAVSASPMHALALRSDGTVAAWGGSYASLFGLGSVPEGLSNVVAIHAGSHSSVAVRDDGTVASWSMASWGPAVPELFGIVEISSGQFGGAAVQHGGRVIGWGNGDALNGLTSVRSLAMNATKALVVFDDGTVQAIGLVGPVPPLRQSPSNAIAAAIGGSSVALTAAREVVDLNSEDNSNLPSGLDDVVAISGAAHRNLALKGDGTVVGWGNITVPAGLSNVTAIAAGNLYTLVVTTNPPAPALAGVAEGNQILLSAPVAVSGYVLEVTEDLSQPYTPVGIYTNIFDLNETNRAAVMLPLSGARKFFRFRKQ